jgi:hypothetical protein
MIRTTATATATTTTARTTQRPRPQDPNRVRPPRDVATCSTPLRSRRFTSYQWLTARLPADPTVARPVGLARTCVNWQPATSRASRSDLTTAEAVAPMVWLVGHVSAGDGPGGLTLGNWRRPAPFPAACLIVSCRWPPLGSASSTRSAPVIFSVCPVTNSSISSTSGSRQRAGRLHADLQHRCCRGAASNSGPRLRAGCS